MGRVYDALKRAGATDSTARVNQPENSAAGGEIRTPRIVPSGTEIEEQLFNVSSIFFRYTGMSVIYASGCPGMR